MKQKTLLLLRAPILICSILMVSLSFHSSLLAQTNKQGTPGTFPRLSTPISSAVTATGLQQFYSSTGRYTISADGIGSLDASMNIRVNKPNAQATVEKAILISSVTSFFGETLDDGCVSIAGVPVNWDGTATVSFFNNYWADVTSIVASTINAFPAGISTLPITECNTSITEGEALLVVFNDPSAAEKTIIVMLGAENPEGDNFSVTLAKPIDPSASGALLDMGLGIGFSYEANGTNQASQVSINNQRISSSAGGEDDGVSANGALLTVGGIGDADDNPTDPFADPTNPRSDDELYSILPFITNTTTSLTINTINPSLDDNIFLAYFVTSGAAIVGEGILLSQTSDSGNVGDDHTVKATLVNSLGQPITGKSVMFTVTSGPNAGNTFSATTDASGNASYTYTGTGGSGTDSIQACFTNSQSQTSCSNTLSFNWTAASTDTPPYFDYPPTPADGITINAHPGENVTFKVKSEDSDAGDMVTLSAAGLPVDASVTPTLPASGNPVSANFMWTPGSGDVGTYPIQFTATDDSGKTAMTNVIVQVTSSGCVDSNFRSFIYAYPPVTVAKQLYHTIYKGYGPQSVVLTAVPHGGSRNIFRYKFKWDNGSTLPVRRVWPSVTTEYDVDITDGKGCTTHASITIHVVDARCGKNWNKVQVCLRNHNLCVDSSLVKFLLRGGAKLGNCNMMPDAVVTASSTNTPDALKTMQHRTFAVYPNPAASSIKFKWDVNVSANTKINIMDLQGRVIITQSVNNADENINISKLSNGVYMAQLIIDGKQAGIARFTVSK